MQTFITPSSRCQRGSVATIRRDKLFRHAVGARFPIQTAGSFRFGRPCTYNRHHPLPKDNCQSDWRQAGYILAVEETKGELLENMRNSFALLPREPSSEKLNCDPKRMEQHHCSVIANLTVVERGADGPRGRAWCGSNRRGTPNPPAQASAKAVTASEVWLGMAILNRAIRRDRHIDNKLLGSWTWAFTKTRALNTPDTPPRTSPLSTVSRSTR